MKYNPDIHHRKSIRLKGYDYSQSGLYFITICTYEGLNFFGEIENGKMILNEYGKIAEEEWFKLEKRFKIKIHEFCVMPNHIHGIIEILEKEEEKQGVTSNCPYRGLKVGSVTCNAQTDEEEQNIEENIYSKISPKKDTLSLIVRSYKGCVSRETRKSGTTFYWHRNYYENIIRNEEVYLKVYEYIENNPKRWDEDKYYNK